MNFGSAFAFFASLIAVGLAPAWAEAQGSPRASLPVSVFASVFASLSGRVLVDTILRPIDGAEILLPDLAKSAIAGVRGEFRLDSIPAGIHTVTARKVGHAVFEARIRFDAGEAVTRVILLPRLTNLNAVVVVGESYVPLSFLEHRAAGLGRFISRSDLEMAGNRRLSDILGQIQGIGVQTGRSNQGWVLSTRYQAPIRFSGLAEDPCKKSPYANPDAMRGSRGEDMYFPDCVEKHAGMKAGCFARVYLDKTLLNTATPADPINVNEYSAHSIEAIEYFASASQVPIEYARLNSNCGVLVLHTRRSP